jgi:hypothetical protein
VNFFLYEGTDKPLPHGFRFLESVTAIFAIFATVAGLWDECSIFRFWSLSLLFLLFLLLLPGCGTLEAAT